MRPYFDSQPATVAYTNYRGETATRHIQPSRLFWGSTEYHPEPQWLLEAWDFGKSAVRVFALEDMLPGMVEGGSKCLTKRAGARLCTSKYGWTVKPCITVLTG